MEENSIARSSEAQRSYARQLRRGETTKHAGAKRWRSLGTAAVALWALGRFLKRGRRTKRDESYGGLLTHLLAGAVAASAREGMRLVTSPSGGSEAIEANGARARAGGSAPREDGRGRQAERPAQIPKAGWRDILLRVKNEMTEDNLSIVAAGVAFYAFLAMFPALAALVSIYGLITTPTDLQQHLKSVEAFLPPDAAQLINDELQRVVQSQESRLGWGAVGGMLLALWSAAKGMKALIQSLNIVYDETEKRGFLRLNATALLLTATGVLLVIVFLGLVVGVPVILRTIGLEQTLGQLLNYLRWPLLAATGMFALALLYRYGPSRDEPRWQWVSWGAAVATGLWLIGSGLFSFYVSNFASYSATYGSLGVVVVLMMWFLLSIYSVLLGAEINAEMERQTTKDTTEGAPEPLGRRGAYAADTVGPSA
jgi:membrane protein